MLGGAIADCVALAEKLNAPVCSNYQHNDSFPGSHRLAVGPLGYNGSKAAMELIAKADVVLALGTRLNPFLTLPGYGIDCWPKTTKIIQVDINPDRIGLTKLVTVGICGDAKQVARQILARLGAKAGDAGRADRKALIHRTKSAWLQALSGMDHEDDDPGTTWNKDARKRDAGRMSPRQAWRAIQAGLPKDASISSDIGDNCAIGNAYPSFERARKYLAPGLFGPCGYGFPSIIGAKIGNPETPAVGFAGDGAFGISMSEMSSIVHGGAAFTKPVVIDSDNLAALESLRKLAPLHNFHGLDAVRTMKEAAPGLPQVACFDTAFHAAQPDGMSLDEIETLLYRRSGLLGLSGVTSDMRALGAQR